MDNMKKYLLLIMFAVAGLTTYAQTATQILNKTASVIGRKGGASANFKISSSKFGSTNNPSLTILLPFLVAYYIPKKNKRLDFSSLFITLFQNLRINYHLQQ